MNYSSDAYSGLFGTSQRKFFMGLALALFLPFSLFSYPQVQVRIKDLSGSAVQAQVTFQRTEKSIEDGTTILIGPPLRVRTDTSGEWLGTVTPGTYTIEVGTAKWVEVGIPDDDNTYELTTLVDSGTFTSAPGAWKIPNYTSAQRDAFSTVADGYLIYNTTTSTLEVYDDGGWVNALAGGGSAIILDLADDDVNESADITEIAITGDTNSIVTEPSDNKVLFNMGLNWPTADAATTATTANAGDSATAFFSAGTIEHERGGLEADVSLYSGLVGINAGATSEVDAKSELEAMIADVADFGMADGDTYTGKHDFGGAVIELTNSATPTTDATGELALDTTITDHQPLWQYYDGTKNMSIIAVDTSILPATDDQILKYDAATDSFLLESDATGAGSGAFSDAADPIVQNTITKDVHIGDGAGTLTGKLEIGGDADQPQVVIEAFSTQTDDVLIIQNDADTEVFSVDVSGNVIVSGTVDGVDIAARDHDAVTLAGTPDYITLAGQVITRGTIDISDDTNLAAGTGISLTGDSLSADIGTSVDASEIDADAVGTSELDDGVDTPLSGEYVRVDTIDQAGFEYRTTAEVLSDIGAESATSNNIDPDRLNGDAIDNNLLDHEIGGLEADVSAYSGLVGINSGATSEVDTEAELETHLGGLDVVAVSTDDITSANLRTALSDESGTGAAIFAGGAIGAATATNPSAGDSDTSVATTAFVQGEIVDEIWYPSGALTPRTTAGAAAETKEYTTNDIDLDRYLFEAVTPDEAVFGTFIFPPNWDSTITVIFYWDPSVSGSGNVVWGAAAGSLDNDDAIDAALGTQVTVTDAYIVNGDVHESAETTAITIAGSPAAGDLIIFEIERLATNGSDTYASDAALLGVLIKR